MSLRDAALRMPVPRHDPRGRELWSARVRPPVYGLSLELEGAPHHRECFIRSLMFIVGNSDRLPAGTRLAHGVYRWFADMKTEHGWVIIPGERAVVFDGVRQRFYDELAYREILETEAEVLWSPDEARQMALYHEWSGPWHTTMPFMRSKFEGDFHREKCERRRTR